MIKIHLLSNYPLCHFKVWGLGALHALTWLSNHQHWPSSEHLTLQNWKWVPVKTKTPPYLGLKTTWTYTILLPVYMNVTTLRPSHGWNHIQLISANTWLQSSPVVYQGPETKFQNWVISHHTDGPHFFVHPLSVDTGVISTLLKNAIFTSI